MADSAIFTLTGSAESYNFYKGQSLRMGPGGEVIRETWARAIWRRLTGPFRRQSVVVAVDHAAGVITVADAPKWYRFL